MHEILPNQLWIGNAGDGRDAARLLEAGVAAVVNLAAEESSPVLPRDLIYCRLPIVDGEQDDESVLDLAICGFFPCTEHYLLCCQVFTSVL